MRQTVFMATVAVFFLFIPVPAFSDEISDLRSELKKIEEQDRVLQQELEKQKEITGLLQKKMELLEGGDFEEVEPPGEMPLNHSLARHPESRFVEIPSLKMNGFMDTGFLISMTKHEHQKSFKQGEVALFLTSEISERVSFLGELVFYPFSTLPRYVLEWQRLSLRYSLSDQLNITIGRMHTALGYWNHAYHHGSWLQTTVLRPEIYRFEYDNGILPVHSVGIEISGGKTFYPLDIEYRVGLMNGRAKEIRTVHNFSDENDAKAVSALVGLRPLFAEGLQVGANLYIDRIPPDPAISSRTDQIDERIVGAHLVYFQEGVELLGEFFKIDHKDRTSGKDFDSSGYYIQGAYKFNKWTPYYRFDRIDVAEGDPYFTPLQMDLRKQTFGLRWDILLWNALKFEYGSARPRNRDREQTLNVNSSFAF